MFESFSLYLSLSSTTRAKIRELFGRSRVSCPLLVRSIVCPSPLHFAFVELLGPRFPRLEKFHVYALLDKRIVARCDSPLNWHTYVGSAHARSAGEFSTSMLPVSHADLSSLSLYCFIFLFLTSPFLSNYRVEKYLIRSPWTCEHTNSVFFIK